jgi:hypothetical protein
MMSYKVTAKPSKDGKSYTVRLVTRDPSGIKVSYALICPAKAVKQTIDQVVQREVA